MQTRFLSALLIAFSAIILFASCSKSNKQGIYIPKTAAVVVHLNGESLTSKLPWEEIKNSELFKEANSDTTVSAYIKAAMDNPENTGIDVKKDMLFFVQKDSLGGYVAIQGSVKDAAKFRQFGIDASKGATESEKDGIHFLTKDKTTASWNNERFAVIIDAPEMNQLNKINSYDTYDSIPKPAPVFRDGKTVAISLYNLKDENSLAKDEKFSELMSTKGDLHFWFNGESFGTGTMGMSALSMLNMSKLTEGSIMASTANFEDGKIVVDIKSYSGKDMQEIWKKYSGDKINSDMVKRIPGKNVAAFFALNFKPEGIREFLKLAGMEGFANMGAGYAGFTLDDFIKANKGDILFVASDIRKDSLKGTDANFLFASSIGDKAAFGKLVDAGKKFGEKQMGFMGDGTPQIFYNSNDNYFAIGNNKATIDTYTTAAGNNSFDFFDKIAGSPAGGYVNFQYILNSMKDESGKDSISAAIFQASLNMWDNLIAKGGEFSGGAISQHMEVNLLDKKTNSLKQLNAYLGTMAALEKKRKEQREKEWNMDWDTQVTDSVAAPSR